MFNMLFFTSFQPKIINNLTIKLHCMHNSIFFLFYFSADYDIHKSLKKYLYYKK